MHGFSSGSTFLINAEVDSMGGVVDGGVGNGNKPSPHRAAIEKAQAELRLEYDVREERRRELEFLEKGGNPLDFKFVHGTSVSVHSTSHTYQQPDQILTSEAKGSFALTASHGDSVESSGRLGVTTTCEPNSADNFDGENEVLETERKHRNSNKISMAASEHSSLLDGTQKVKELENSPIFYPKKGQAYRRRNRSRPNRDAIRSNSKNVASLNQFDVESDGTHAFGLSTTLKISEISEGNLNILISKDKQDVTQNDSVEVDEIPAITTIIEPDNTSAPQLVESGKVNGDLKSTPNDALICDGVILPMGLDSESLCNQTSHNIDGNGNRESDIVSKLKNVDDSGPPLGEKSISVGNQLLIEKLDTNTLESTSCFKEDENSISRQDNGFIGIDQEIDKERFSSRDKVECAINVEKIGVQDNIETKIEEFEACDVLGPKVENSCLVGPPSSDPSFEVNKSDVCGPSLTSEVKISGQSQHKQFDKAEEDRVLEEARVIEAKRRRIAELSVGLMPNENRRKSHWDFIVEEMAWLANDFTQERVWKITAASQICHRAAFIGQLRMEEQSKYKKEKSTAQKLAKDVMEFWRSASLCVGVDSCAHSSLGVNETGHGKSEPRDLDKDEASKEKQQSLGKSRDLAVFKYAVRILQKNCSSPLVKFDCSTTQDVVSDDDITEVLWPDQLTEENLFYVVPPYAMETYRKSIESCLEEFESASFTSIQEEVDTSMYEPTTEIVYHKNDYDDYGENMYYLPGSGAHESRRPIKKKQKSLKIYANRYISGNDFSYGGANIRDGTPPSLLGKRGTNNLQVGLIPTKRTRTAPRQRVFSGVGPTPCRTDASSGDTNSFQDDQSTLNGPVFGRGSEVDSPIDYNKHLMIDSWDNLGKTKKKKKFKNSGASYSGWPGDPALQHEQKDNVRKRDDHPIDSSANSFNDHHMKKPKIKHLENSFENIIPTSGSMASPVASQMSNMSSQNRIIKIFGGRDRRKAKGIKVQAAQPGSGSPWSSFEDQALIVLVHDMGPNWELVSDAINSTLRFKCIFRKPQECKERHKNLMDRTPSDGADSADDSGSSQHYPSTLPGIPKGSARQLFQQLQRPMEEDTVKSHFEKIIHIAKQFHYRKKQNDNYDLKQIAPVHGSHVGAFSQVIPNNLNGVILTPLDLCDLAMSNQDSIPLGFQGPHVGGLPLSTQGGSPSMHPPSGLNSSIQGLPGSLSMGMGNNLASQSSQFSNSRDARYPIPRSTSLPLEEHQRLQQYGQMQPGRNGQTSNLTSGSLSGTDRGVRMLPSGNSVRIVGGMSRSMPSPRPGLQGVTSSMLNSGSVGPTNIGGVPNNLNVETSSGQGNMYRAREPLHVVRPGKSSEHQRQMILPETSTSGVVPPFGALTCGLTSQTTSPPLKQYNPSHHQQLHPIIQQHSHMLGAQNHPLTPYLRIASRQMKHRILQRQHLQQQRPPSNALTTPVTPSSSSTHVSATSSLGFGRDPQSGAGGRQHPQQRQQSQPVKVPKGMGRKEMEMDPNIPVDPSHLNGFNVNSGNRVSEKGEKTGYSMKSQGLYSGLGLNETQPSKSSSSHLQQQKSYPNSVQPIPCNNPGPLTTVSSIPTSVVVNQSHLDHQRETDKKNRESLIDCVMTSNPTIGHTNSSGNEKLPSVSESLGQIHGVQFQHQQLPLQNVSSIPQKQLKHQLEKSAQVSQLQPQAEIQAGKSSSFGRNPNS